jgi:hypothetical protein
MRRLVEIRPTGRRLDTVAFRALAEAPLKTHYEVVDGQVQEVQGKIHRDDPKFAS